VKSLPSHRCQSPYPPLREAAAGPVVVRYSEVRAHCSLQALGVGWGWPHVAPVAKDAPEGDDAQTPAAVNEADLPALSASRR